MKWRFLTGVARGIKLLALVACLLIPPGTHAATLYGWTITDQIVKFDTADPTSVEVVSNLSGLPSTMNVRAGGMGWDPSRPDKLYTLGHQSNFGPYWLLEIDIDTGVTNPIFILQGYSMSALTYMDNANVTGLVTARANSGNQDTDLYQLGYDGSMTFKLPTSFDNQTLAWDSKNDVLHSVGAPAFIGGTSYLKAIPNFPSPAVPDPYNIGLPPTASGHLIYSASDDSLYYVAAAFPGPCNYPDPNSNSCPPNGLWRLNTTNGGTPIQYEFLGTVAGNFFAGLVEIPQLINYSCNGFEAPMNAGAVKVKKNRALPFKAILLDSEGNPVTDSDINALPVIEVIYTAGTGPAVDVTGDAIPVGLGTSGNQFEYTYDGKWQYNLKTKNYTASGSYTVSMIPGDSYTIDPACTATFIID